MVPSYQFLRPRFELVPFINIWGQVLNWCQLIKFWGHVLNWCQLINIWGHVLLIILKFRAQTFFDFYLKQLDVMHCYISMNAKAWKCVLICTDNFIFISMKIKDCHWRCLFRFSARLNELPHSLPWCGFSPLWVRICLVRSDFVIEE